MFPHLGSIPAYSVAYVGGIALHLILSLWFARRLGIRMRVAWLLGVSYAVSMTLGARLLFDLTHEVSLRVEDVIQPGYLLRGGLWGGPLLHLVLAACVALTIRDRAAALDVVALALPLPMALAKVGCFLNGCCYGAAALVPWGVVFPISPGGAPAGVPIHPVQLYETGLLLAIFGVLLTVRGPGLRLPYFLLIYGLGRGTIEFVRGDAASRFAIGPIAASQLICFGVVAAAAVLIGRRARRSPSRPLPPNAESPTSEA